MRKTGQKPYRKLVKCKKKNCLLYPHANGLCNNPLIIVFV